LGHQGHPVAEKLGLDFYEYALSLREEKSKVESDRGNRSAKSGKSRAVASNQPWPESFRNPAFVGDIVNQEIFRFERAAMVPTNFVTPLPTRELAETWDREP